jgi:1-acyl-sn-glycerol-3-phosphate acyltransferase
MRRAVNAVVVAVGLAVALPTIVVAERLRAGGGRRVARRTVAGLSRLCGIDHAVHGLDRLDPSATYVFVPNHTSPVDIPALLLARPDVRFAGAAELFRMPLLGAAMRALDVLAVDRTRPTDAHRALTALATATEQRSVVVFPEGGMVAPGEQRRFKTGAFSLAIEMGAAVVPVSIHGTAEVLPRGRRFGVGRGTVVVRILEPIETAGLTQPDRKALRDLAETAVRQSLAGAT